MSARLVILDRDGVINEDSPDFIKSPAEWSPIDGSLDAIARLAAAGFKIAVASNQSGVGRGLFDEQILESIQQKMCDLIAEAGGRIDEIVYCPHHPDDDCNCRKPKPGMLERLSARLATPLAGVPVIGDSLRDIEAAQAVGARPVLVLTGNGRQTAALLVERGEAVETYADLDAAVTALLAAAENA